MSGNVSTKAKLRRVRVTFVSIEEQKRITYSDSVSVALGIQYAKRMLLGILPFVACLAVSYFSTLSHERHVFRKT
jgi:hypothetical protein